MAVQIQVKTFVERLRVSKHAFVAAKKSAFASWNQQEVL